MGTRQSGIVIALATGLLLGLVSVLSVSANALNAAGREYPPSAVGMKVVPGLPVGPGATGLSGAGGVVLSNGDFEDGSGAGWTEFSNHGWALILNASSLSSAGVTPHGGQWAAWLGGATDEIASISQTVTISGEAPVLSFWMWTASVDECGYDFGRVLVDGDEVLTVNLCSTTNTGGWVNQTLDLEAYNGRTVEVRIRAETDGTSNSNLFLDDVGLHQWHVYVPVVSKGDDS